MQECNPATGLLGWAMNLGSPSQIPSLETIRSRLQAVGQDHALTFYPSLAAAEQRVLLEQLAELDLEALPRFIERYVINKLKFELPARLDPAPYFPRDPDSPKRPWDRAAAKRRGEELIRTGKVA